VRFQVHTTITIKIDVFCSDIVQFGKEAQTFQNNILPPSGVWLTVHRNSVWIRNQLDVTFGLSFISLLQVAQPVSGNHVSIFRS